MTWIRANLNVTVSVELWDRFLDVVSSLTHWSEVVSEWKVNLVVEFKSFVFCRCYSEQVHPGKLKNCLTKVRIEPATFGNFLTWQWTICIID